MSPKHLLLVAGGAMALAACTPTIRIEPSDKPFKFDLNVKIDQEVRVKLDREVDQLIEANPGLFPS